VPLRLSGNYITIVKQLILTDKNNILIIGAFDRYNYGDLLFPLVIEAQLRTYGRPFHASYFGIIESDLRAVGGKPTQDIRAFYEQCNQPEGHTSVIVAGGEAVAVTWNSLLLALNKLFMRTRRFHRHLEKVIDLNDFARRILHGQTELPFAVTPADFKGVNRVIFNSLGGSELGSSVFGRFPRLRDRLQQVDYFAVRDRATHVNMEKQGIHTHLYPDSAILMSKFYPRTELIEKVSPPVADFTGRQCGKYLFFQVKDSHARNNEQQIARQLNAIAERHPDVHLCLCPIGKALNHDDHLALQRIAPLLRYPYTFFETVTIWDIMGLIAHAKAYMGTSLHGAITAMSYAVPYVGVVVPKLNSYLQTWGVDGINQTVALDELAEAFQRAISVDKVLLDRSREEQLCAAETSFSKIATLVLPE